MALDAGKIFVQLKLDDKEYKQRLSDDLRSTEATTKGIESAWRALGTKTEQSYNLQAKAAQNAYTLIKNSAQSTTNGIIRAEEAKVAKINFSMAICGVMSLSITNSRIARTSSGPYRDWEIGRAHV